MVGDDAAMVGDDAVMVGDDAVMVGDDAAMVGDDAAMVGDVFTTGLLVEVDGFNACLDREKYSGI